MVFFILAVIIQQIDYFLMPDNLCCSEHPKTIHQGKKQKCYCPCLERKGNLIGMRHLKDIFYHLIQQTGKPCANQRTKQKGPSADDTVFSKEQIPYCLCFHANQFVGCKLLFPSSQHKADRITDHKRGHKSNQS